MTTTTQTTSAFQAGIFIPPDVVANGSYAGSQLGVCNNHATFAIQCTAASKGVTTPVPSCGPNAPTITITAAITEVTYTHQTVSDSTTVSISETCTLDGVATASCVASHKTSAGGTVSSSAVTTSVGQWSDFNQYVRNINVTAGSNNVGCNHSSGSSTTRSFGTVLAGLVFGMAFSSIVLL